MKCNFKPTDVPDNDGKRRWKCSRCGYETAPTIHEPKRFHGFPPCKVIGWGDYLTYYLALVGLTKQRVQWFTGKPDCGCADRQEKLNTWGERLRAWWLKGTFR